MFIFRFRYLSVSVLESPFIDVAHDQQNIDHLNSGIADNNIHETEVPSHIPFYANKLFYFIFTVYL